MDWTLRPAPSLSGEIETPADKSITHRAIMFSALAEGESRIDNYLSSDDCLRTLAAFQAMGVAVERSPERLRIRGTGPGGLKRPSGPVDAGNSGTTVRLLSGILAGRDFAVTIVGDESLSRRPMRRIMEPLRRMGAALTAREDDFLPLTIRGTKRLAPIRYQSPVASAQVKSCVLLAGMQARGVTTVEEPFRSRDHTERMLKAFGADISVDGTRVSVRGPAHLQAQSFSIPGDISSAAFFLAAGVLVPDAEIVVRNVGINPTRDGILEVLGRMGARCELLAPREVSGEPVADIRVRSSSLVSADIGAALMPRLIDEIPLLALAATQATGTTVISGARELRAKESDRIATVARELGRMGADIEEKDDGLVIRGPVTLRGATVESHGDHRIAMMLAVAGLIAAGETVVRDVDCVTTSFPAFMSLLEQVRK